MSNGGIAKIYGRLAIGMLLFGSLVFFEGLFTGPLSFVTGLSDASLSQWVKAAFAFTVTLLAARIVRWEIIHGWLERRSGKKVPELIGDMLVALVVFVGICLIVALIFKRDITGLVAAGGASVMIIGIALQDVIMALFTGILLNVEKPFKVGDMVCIDDKYVGKIERITWRTTVLQTRSHDIIFIPNISLANAVILNQSLPDPRSKRVVEVMIDYDTSVESAERILYAAVLGAVGVQQIDLPTVFARKMTQDGVLYEVAFTIKDWAQDKKSEHAVIKSILKCMRDAEITVSHPKLENTEIEKRVSIANRSQDVFRLVQQCRLFRSLPDDVSRRISEALVERHFAAGASIVQGGDSQHAVFIMGEGMAKRTISNRDGSKPVSERFIATEFFGRRSLFACQPQVATVQAETAVLVYELERRALTRLIQETPDLIKTLAQALAQLAWTEAHEGNHSVEPAPAVLERLINLHQGQIEAKYV